MSHVHLQALNEANDCDKAPVLEKIQLYIAHLQESHERLSLAQERMSNSQERMTDAMTEIARHQERIISLAEKQEHNEKDIDNLYKLQRDTDRRITDHILSSGHSPSGQLDNISTKAQHWDKLTLSVITAAFLGAAGVVWRFVVTVLQKLQLLGG